MTVGGSLREAVFGRSRARDPEARSQAIKLDGPRTEEFVKETMQAPALGANRRLDYTAIVRESEKIQRASDEFVYTRDVNYTINYAAGVWTNVDIPDGEALEVLYFHEEASVDGHVIFDQNNTELPQRKDMRFLGNVNAYDDAGNERTVIEILAAGGTSTQEIHVGPTPPAEPHSFKYWIDTSVVPAVDKWWDGAAWQSIGGGSTAPHDHDDRYYTEAEVDSLLSGKAASVHNHDDLYYTETEMDSLLAGKSDTTHTHDGRYYTEAEVDSLIGAISEGHVVLDDTTQMAQRGKLRFRNGFTLTDDAAADSTIVDAEAQQGGGGHTIQDEGTNLTQRPTIDFRGSGVRAFDEDATNKTVVEINTTAESGNIRYATLIKWRAA